MKTLSKRNQIVLALAGIALVVLVGGFVLVQPGGLNLLGATTSLYLSPASLNLSVGQSVNVRLLSTAPMAAPACNWSTQNTAIKLSNITSTSVTVTGMSEGTSGFKASCNVGSILGTATVVGLQPQQPSLP